MRVRFASICNGAWRLFGGLKSIINADDSETYGVGEVAEQEGCTIKLTNVIEGQGNSLYTPQKGNVYLILNLKSKYVE